ncbi:MAG: methionyl-tRNA formyltransferase [Atribacterota bacterium]
MSKKISLVFMTSTLYGWEIVKKLNKLEFINLNLVITAKDKPYGRRRKIKESPIKRLCREISIRCYQTDDVNSQESLRSMRATASQVLIVVDFGQILSGEVLKLFPEGCFNIHYSILPDLRGPAPVRWALLKGYKKTGVSIIRMAEKVDKGDIIISSEVDIEHKDNYFTLKQKLTNKAIKLAKDVIKRIYKGEEIKYLPQKEMGEPSYAPKIEKRMTKIIWKKEAQDILNQIRAFSPEPGSYTIWKKNNRRVKIYKAEKTSQVADEFGIVNQVNKNYFSISCGRESLKILEIQPAGKRKMDVKEFLAGNNIEPGDEFE